MLHQMRTHAASSDRGGVYLERDENSHHLILGCFVFFGALSLLLAVGCYTLFSLWFSHKVQVEGVSHLFFIWMVNVPLEELSKFLCFIVLSTLGRTIVKPRDGNLQGAAVGLGFGLAENLLYFIKGYGEIGFLRFFSSVPGHMIYGSLWGGIWGIEVFFKTRKKKKWGHMSLALILAIFFHALFNTLCFFNVHFVFAIVVDFCALVLSIVLFGSRNFSYRGRLHHFSFSKKVSFNGRYKKECVRLNL